jgi:hypothetical protein
MRRESAAKDREELTRDASRGYAPVHHGGA